MALLSSHGIVEDARDIEFHEGGIINCSPALSVYLNMKEHTDEM